MDDVEGLHEEYNDYDMMDEEFDMVVEEDEGDFSFLEESDDDTPEDRNTVSCNEIRYLLYSHELKAINTVQ